MDTARLRAIAERANQAPEGPTLYLIKQVAEAEARIATLEGEKAELQRQIDGPEAEDFVSLTQQLKEMTDTWRLEEGKLDAAEAKVATLEGEKEGWRKEALKYEVRWRERGAAQ